MKCITFTQTFFASVIVIIILSTIGLSDLMPYSSGVMGLWFLASLVTYYYFDSCDNVPCYPNAVTRQANNW